MPLDHARDVVSEVFETVSTPPPALPIHAPNTLQDMPPLADNGRNTTYTFSPGMTPLSFASTSAPTAAQDPSPQPSSPFVSSSPTSPISSDPSTNSFAMSTAPSRPHGKRRDPSYIPRPPNAFILFRCAFIKEQNVPGRVEGNHSRLSKIIGLCWKQLSPEDREKWEAKAVVAQAEHRAHYPDWRFRPGANAMAKLKIKEGESSATARRRSVRSRAKDTPAEEEDAQPVSSDSKGKGKEKGKGKARVSHTVSLDETRCAKIAGFVAEGIKGKELEVAVKQWEGDHKLPRPTITSQQAKSKGRGTRGPPTSHIRSRSDVTFAVSPSQSSKLDHDDSSVATTSSNLQNFQAASSNPDNPDDSSSGAEHPQNATVDTTSVQISDVPLTHMFKRSLSAPAQNNRPPHLQASPSDPSDSSTDEFSPTSAEPSPGAWGSFKAPAMPSAPTGTHTQTQRNPISFPTTSTAVSPAYESMSPLAWGESGDRRRLGETQEPNLWWPQKSNAIASQFGFDAGREAPITVSPNEMGYEIPQGGSQFDRNYLETYGSYNSPEEDISRVKWTDVSTSQQRQGLTVVLEDPYKDDCGGTNHPPVASPTSLSLPPLSSSSYYYPVSPDSASTFASSSYSTLTGWAGENKHAISEQQMWPDSASPVQSAPSSSWYSSENTSTWGMSPPQLQHAQLSHEPDDWDRLEYRAASNLRLPVEPQRQLSFQDELRRANNTS